MFLEKYYGDFTRRAIPLKPRYATKHFAKQRMKVRRVWVEAPSTFQKLFSQKSAVFNVTRVYETPCSSTRYIANSSRKLRVQCNGDRTRCGKQNTRSSRQTRQVTGQAGNFPSDARLAFPHPRGPPTKWGIETKRVLASS